MLHPTPKKVKSILSHFKRSTKGNIAVISALVVSLLAVGVGSAVDVSKAHKRRALMQSVADVASLAGAQGTTNPDIRRLGQASYEYYADNNPDLGMTGFNIRSTSTRGVRQAVVNIQGESSTTFLGIIGIDTIPINVTSTSNREVTPIEISLVLDVSFSMRGNKIARLRVAAEEFIETIIGDSNSSPVISFNIIPFAGNVNIGSTLAETIMVPPSRARLDPSDTAYANAITNNNRLASRGFRFSDGMNCIETVPADYRDTGRFPPDSRSQLPRFVIPQSNLTYCPEDDSSTLFNINRKNVLIDKIRTMSLAHGTAMDVGTLWGLKALSPNYGGLLGGDIPNRPRGFRSNVVKVMVVMTDGQITRQRRPLEHSNPNSKNGNLAASPGLGTVYDQGTDSTTRDLGTATGRFNTACDLAKANNVQVYTIGYNIPTSSFPERILQDCASSSANYHAASTTNISSVFSAIAASLRTIRIAT